MYFRTQRRTAAPRPHAPPRTAHSALLCGAALTQKLHEMQPCNQHYYLAPFAGGKSRGLGTHHACLCARNFVCFSTPPPLLLCCSSRMYEVRWFHATRGERGFSAIWCLSRAGSPSCCARRPDSALQRRDLAVHRCVSLEPIRNR